MNVILSGGGSGEQTEKLDRLFAEQLTRHKPLLYIPIAMDEDKIPYPDCKAFIRSTFEPLGIHEYVMWTENELAQHRPVHSFSGIYIGGGNTFHLLKTLRDTGMLEYLKRALDEDIPIYGGSAGALIFGASIATALYYDENWPGLNELDALNIIDGDSIICHYTPEDSDKVLRIAAEHPELHLLALTERTGLHVQDHAIQVIGDAPAYRVAQNKLIEIAVGRDIRDP